MQHSSKPWWMSDGFIHADPVPTELNKLAGPKGIALVRAWPDGRTDRGWGGNDFMPEYVRDAFNARKVLYGYNRGRWAFAFIMRSMRLVCVDIDGKNGGIDQARRLVLPPTLAETSKSGNGYHLFYRTQEEWDHDFGFASLHDRIGFEQGLDFRATGCVYHHSTQRWNDRSPALMPEHLKELLLARQARVAASTARISSVLADNDDMEVLMLQDEILGKLAKPIPAGKRNNTLFAIGCEMLQAGIEGWDRLLAERATEVGLDLDEIDKLIANIGRYVAVSP